MELRRLWQTLWKRRVAAGAAFTASLGLGVVVTALTPPIYQAHSKILLEVRDHTMAAMGPDLGSMRQLSSLSVTSSPLDTQAEVLRSTPVIERVIAALDLKTPSGSPMSVGAFKGSGNVISVRGTDVLDVSFRDRDPAIAKNVTDAWVKAYMSQHRASIHIEASEAVKFIGKRLTDTKKELATAETKLRDYKRRYGAADLTDQARTTLEGMATLEVSYRQANASHAESQARLARLRRQMGGTANAVMQTTIGQDETGQQLRRQLVEAQTSPLLSNPQLGADHPDIKRQRARIAALTREIDRHSHSLVGRPATGAGALAPFDPMRQELARALVLAEVDAAGQANRAASLRRMVSTSDSRLASLPDREYALTRLTRNATVASEMYRILLKRYEDARVQAAMSVGNAHIIESARLPVSPISPIPFMNLGLAAIVGLALAFAIPQLLAAFEETIVNVDGAERALGSGVAVLGVVPWYGKGPKGSRLLLDDEDHSPAAESIRMLRTNLRFQLASRGGTGGSVIGISSSTSGEGKSLTIANLAVAFAQGGQRTLLIDADMRNATQHRLFGLSSTTGLALLLVEQPPLEGFVRQGPDGLHVITAGIEPRDPVALLEGEAFAKLIAAVRDRYDVILVDLPPVLPVPDAHLVAKLLDGFMLVVGVDRATAKSARQANALLAARNVPVLGMIVTRLRADADPHYQKFYSGYYARKEVGLFGRWRRAGAR